MRCRCPRPFKFQRGLFLTWRGVVFLSVFVKLLKPPLGNRKNSCFCRLISILLMILRKLVRFRGRVRFPVRLRFSTLKFPVSGVKTWLIRRRSPLLLRVVLKTPTLPVFLISRLFVPGKFRRFSMRGKSLRLPFIVLLIECRPVLLLVRG